MEAIDETIAVKKTKLSPVKTIDDKNTILIEHGHPNTQYTTGADVFNETCPVRNDTAKDDIEYELIDVVDEKFYKGNMLQVYLSLILLRFQFICFK